MSDVVVLQCYNKGCLKKYPEDEDNESKLVHQLIIFSLFLPSFLYVGACTHHPGVPVFHDAMKVSVVLKLGDVLYSYRKRLIQTPLKDCD